MSVARIAMLFVVLGTACKRQEVKPVSNPEESGAEERAQRPRVLLNTEEALPTAAVADALQQGYRCFALPGAARAQLSWQSRQHKLLFAERDSGLSKHWRRVALDLATGTTTVEAAETPAPAFAPAVRASGADAQVGDMQLPNSDGAFAVRPATNGQAALLALEDNTWKSLVTMGPARWYAAVPLPGGVLAALLAHDTDGDEKITGDDEMDVCLVAPALQPVTIDTRQVPKRWNPVFGNLVSVLRALLGEDSTVVVKDRGETLQIWGGNVPSDQPVLLLVLLDKVQTQLATITRDPQVQLELRWKNSDHAAQATWWPDLGKLVRQARAGDRVLLDRRDAEVSVESLNCHREHDFTLRCGGTARFIGQRASQFVVQYWIDEHLLTPNQTFAAVLPGNTFSWTMALKDVPEITTPQLRIVQNGHRIPWFDAQSSRDLEDWLPTQRRLVEAPGTYVQLSKGATDLAEDWQDSGLKHEMSRFHVPNAFETWTPVKQQSFISKLLEELGRHQMQFHEGKANSQLLVDGKGHVWMIDKGVLKEGSLEPGAEP